VVGPNGAGKSTLLKILAFLDRPDRGNIHFRGDLVGPGDFHRLRRQITMVDQTPLLFQGTVFDNVAYGLRVRKVPSSQWSGQVAEALSRVDLGGFARRSVKGLSGGEVQRVAIARALVFQPRVILLDEPTAGIDAARVEMVEQLITELSDDSGVSVLFSTHNLTQAYQLTDRMIHLHDGKTVAGNLDNQFTGQAILENGACQVQLPGGASLSLDSRQSGAVRLAIPADSIGIEPFTPRHDQANRFDGIIIRMELRGENIRLHLTGELNLRVELSPGEVQRQGLQIGDRVSITLPPESIRLLSAESANSDQPTSQQGKPT